MKFCLSKHDAIISSEILLLEAFADDVLFIVDVVDARLDNWPRALDEDKRPSKLPSIIVRDHSIEWSVNKLIT